LPAGVQLADENYAGQHCFIILEGRANVEAGGRRLGELTAGAFVGLVDQDGRPLPASGLTVHLATHSRVLVMDAGRLAELVNSDPAAAAALHQLTHNSPAAQNNG
jgi:CRP-like cAMP-binding protein